MKPVIEGERYSVRTLLGKENSRMDPSGPESDEGGGPG